ncbi:MAG: autotransporter-associated beta strand repeat-containing protein, partial [Tepidisphaeraceae bacterium]
MQFATAFEYIMRRRAPWQDAFADGHRRDHGHRENDVGSLGRPLWSTLICAVSVDLAFCEGNAMKNTRNGGTDGTTFGNLLNSSGRKRASLALALAAAGAIAPCRHALGQLTGTATITTNTGITANASAPYQADFSSPSITGWLDYTNNTQSNPAGSGPGQVFIPTSNITLQSIAVKGFGNSSASGLGGNWTITVGSVNSNNDFYGAPVTILDQETAAGTPIQTDVTNHVLNNYDMFTLQNQIALTANNEYFFAITSNNASNGNGASAWYGLAMSDGQDPLYLTQGISAMMFNDGSTSQTIIQQNNESNSTTTGGLDFTYYINATLGAAVNVNASWITNGNGNFADAPNWSPGLPNTAGSTATFGTNGGLITTSPTVNVAGGASISSMTFSNPKGYTISGAGSVTAEAAAAISVTAGNNTINLTGGLGLASNAVTISVATGSSLAITNIIDTTYGGLTLTGGGTLTMGSVSPGYGLNLLNNGGTLVLANGSETQTSNAIFWDLQPVAGALIDLGQNNYINNNSLNNLGTVNIGAGTTLVTAQGNGFTFPGSITGSGSIIFGAASATVAQTAALTGASPAFSGSITVAETYLLQVGAGTVLGNNSSTNTLTFDSGNLQALGNVNIPQTITIEDTQSLSNNNTVIDTQTNTLTLSGQISGGNSLQKIGTGELVLDASNSYTGGTNVTAGTLVVGVSGA